MDRWRIFGKMEWIARIEVVMGHSNGKGEGVLNNMKITNLFQFK